MKDDLSQEIHIDMIFSVYMYKCYKYDITLPKNKSKMIFSQKDTSSNAPKLQLCTFMETFIDVFNEKTQET